MKSLRIAKLNALQWSKNAKYPAALLFLVLYMWDLLHGLVDYANSIECTLTPWVFPLLPSGAPVISPIMLAYVMLISDAPFCTRQQQAVLLRVGKVSWICGQLLYIFLLSIGFTILVYILSFIYILPVIEWSSEWGPGLTTGAMTGAHGRYSFVAMQYGCIRGISAPHCTLWVAGIMIFVCFLLGVIMTVCNLWLRDGTGTVIVAGLTILPMIIRTFSTLGGTIKYLFWISPVSWMDRSLMGHTNQGLPSYEYALLMPILLAVGISIFCTTMIHKCDLEMDKE